VSQYDARIARAARDRDTGVRKVAGLTWRAGLAGVACSALIGGALAHQADASTASTDHGPQRGEIIIPGQPPRPATGSGQVSSGAS